MRFLKSIENQTLLAIVLAIFIGLSAPGLPPKIALIGDIFLRLLKMVIAPLIFASVYTSLAGLGNISRIKNIGLKTLAYYMATTSLAVITGLVFVNVFRPGANANFEKTTQQIAVKGLTITDLVKSLIPENPVKSLAQGDVLPTIFFAFVFGLATLSLNEKSRTNLFSFFEAVNDALIALIRWIIRLTPLGVFAIVSNIVAEKGITPILELSSYVITVVLALFFHAAFTLSLLLFLFAREKPWRYFFKIREAPMVAFSTASSSATLPISLEVAEEKAKVPKKIAGFVLPLGATVNMDGTALYEAVAAMFIANIYHVPLGLHEQILIFLTATLASIGAAGIPSAGLVTMTLVLQAVGLPLEGIGLILAVDRFLDMLRTSVNVWGDLVGCKIITKLS
ncbi:dicarboxylate/amino acid:cation symporter [Thermodesulfatator atlanticus]|uniref:dicarboxylate/amino acid:cation symporter n=1 Tax=Thermodesulfatator atlanticus TaxID=501497 RepID=UPI0003B44AD6|nr:dicarboxylate/amino acid:cation symporter [Thermodesulfatator atlanticus]